MLAVAPLWNGALGILGPEGVDCTGPLALKGLFGPFWFCEPVVDGELWPIPCAGNEGKGLLACEFKPPLGIDPPRGLDAPNEGETFSLFFSGAFRADCPFDDFDSFVCEPNGLLADWSLAIPRACGEFWVSIGPVDPVDDFGLFHCELPVGALPIPNGGGVF